MFWRRPDQAKIDKRRELCKAQISHLLVVYGIRPETAEACGP